LLYTEWLAGDGTSLFIREENLWKMTKKRLRFWKTEDIFAKTEDIFGVYEVSFMETDLRK
jgi:hypothetical protein